ncbi:beta-glucosidase 12-like isoform X3 [Andrographis paniculata]|uniref:beta-glucosidase 12-like isoform X3 n=1 Tax=Andrographis paniculata TaxID=175694 RepID=UPI0021E911E0|nr:beta-glucosidase 12-like isoform X3 [Andrographis paniculata]
METLKTSVASLLPLLLLLTAFLGTAVGADVGDYDLSEFNRSSFPPGFFFGAASAAYQYEGAAAIDGKGPSIWDTYTHKYPEKITDRSNGDVALDMYHRYKDDIKLMKSLKLDAFRMSISWPRILPTGKLNNGKGINQKGIDYYRNFFLELKANGIVPYVTLFHWDVPQALEDEYLGFLSPNILNDFKDFANVCFQNFGDLVKNWMTLNEPLSFANNGYDGGFFGHHAPGRCSNDCPEGNSATEPYIVAHHLLLAHAKVVKLYKQKYQAVQKGKIGIVLVSHWFEPRNRTNPQDIKAARRVIDFMFGWFIHPIVYGSYPKTMIDIVGSRLPKFTPDQVKLLIGSFDFVGINYYTGNYVSNIRVQNGILSNTNDKMANLSTTDINGVPIGKPTGVKIFFSFPQGLRELLIYTKKNYKNPTIIISESGIGDQLGTSVEESTNDPQRIDFYNTHLNAVREAIAKGVNVKGFFAWTFMDCFEWGSGYTLRFGLVYTNYNDNLKRIPKKSALWVRKGLAKK